MTSAWPTPSPLPIFQLSLLLILPFPPDFFHPGLPVLQDFLAVSSPRSPFLGDVLTLCFSYFLSRSITTLILCGQGLDPCLLSFLPFVFNILYHSALCEMIIFSFVHCLVSKQIYPHVLPTTLSSKSGPCLAKIRAYRMIE